jgi:hypothetical protein
MVPFGQPVPALPEDKDNNGKPLFRAGFHVLVAGRVLGGVRELTSNTLTLMGAVHDLWKVFVEAPEAQAGKIPLVTITHTVPVVSGAGGQKTTNYRPVFKICSWVDREHVPGLGERTVPAPRPPNGATVVQAAAPTPPPPAPLHTAPTHPAPVQMPVDDEMPF